MESSRSETLITALGFSPETGVLYDRLLPLAGRPVAAVAGSLGLTPEALADAVAPLAEFGIVTVGGGRLDVLRPADVVAVILERTAERAQVAHERLLNVSRAIPYVAGSAVRMPPSQVAEERPVDGEVFTSRDLSRVVETLVKNTTGDLLWMRTEVWPQPYEDQMVAIVAEAVAAGRCCRAIYPVRAFAAAPVEMSVRARAGEQIRLIADVPTRLLVVGTTHAMVPEPLGEADTPRVLVRQRAIVETATLLFEELWRRAAPVAEFERGQAGARRTLLLEQLADGAQDEQIARRMGISLRTVRRRVAALMAELDANSRFQAGVEAVRRGWL